MASSSERCPVSVKISFQIHGDKSSTQSRRTFDESNCEPARLGIPEGRTPSKVSFLLAMEEARSGCDVMRLLILIALLITKAGCRGLYVFRNA